MLENMFNFQYNNKIILIISIPACFNEQYKWMDLQDIYNAIFSVQPEMVNRLPCEWSIQLGPDSTSEVVCAHALRRLPPRININEHDGHVIEPNEDSSHNSPDSGRATAFDMILHWKVPHELNPPEYMYIDDYSHIQLRFNYSRSRQLKLDFLRQLYPYYQQMDRAFVSDLANIAAYEDSEDQHQNKPPPKPDWAREHNPKRQIGKNENLKMKNEAPDCEYFDRESTRTYKQHPFYFAINLDSIGKIFSNRFEMFTVDFPHYEIAMAKYTPNLRN